MNFQISLMSKKVLAWATVFALVLSTVPTIVATHDDEDTINVENGVFAWTDDELNNDLAFYAHSAGDDLSNITINVWKKLPSGNWSEYDDGETDEDGEVVFYNVTGGEYMWDAYDGNEKIDNEGGYSLVSNNYDLGHVGVVDDDIFVAYVFEGEETIDSAYVEIYNPNGTLVDYGYTDEEEDDNFTFFFSDDLEFGYYDFSIWEEYNNSDSLLQNGSFHFFNETESDYSEWFGYIEDYVYDDDNDGYDDTIEWEYDPNTECECEIGVTIVIDVYDHETEDWIDGDDLNHTIYYDDDDWLSHFWDPWYNGTFDFFVKLYDEDGNLEDTFSSYNVTLNVRGQGGGDDDDDGNVDDYLGVVFEGDGWSEDAYYAIYDDNGTWIDGGHPNNDGIFISEDLEEGWYNHYIYLNNDTDDPLQKGPFYSYGDSTNHTVINVDMAILEDEDEDGEPELECSDNGTCDDAYFRAHQGYWDDGISNVTIQISKYDDNGTLEDYEVIYTNESGDAVSYDSPCGEYVWEATYFGDDIDDGTYQIWANCDDPGVEDYGIGHYGVIDWIDWGDDEDEDYDEWFEEWYYEYESNDTVTIYFDPNTECDCDIYVYVDVYVYDSDGDYVGHFSDEGYIYGDEEDWWDLEFTADYTDYYDFYFYLYDDDGNSEDNFTLFEIYLDTDGSDEDYDEWFENWDYEYESNDTVEIAFDPNTECDCDVYVYVEIQVYDSDGDYVGHLSDEGYIYGDEEDWWYLEFAAEHTDYYDFYANLYDEYDNWEDNFSFYDIYLEVDDNGTGDGDGNGIGHFGQIIDWEDDGYVNDYLGAVAEDGDWRDEAYFEVYDFEDYELVDSGHPNEGGLFVSYNLAEGEYVGYVYYEEDGDLLQASRIYSYGNSSGNDSDYINVEMAVLEDEDEGGDFDIFCGDGPCDEALFFAHIGSSDNGVSNVTIEICKYEDDDDDCVYYDTIYTNDTGEASTYDGPCGTYEWQAIYDGNQIDGGMYQIWADCSNTGGSGDGDGVGHAADIDDFGGDGYVNDYIGGVTEGGEFRTEAYFEIRDFENDEIIDSGHANGDGLFFSYNLAEGAYSEYIYYEEDGDLLQASYIYSYGNSSGDNSDYINVDMAVLEDEDEDGEPNIFCEDGPCDDAFFNAHRGSWDNGVSDVTIEICKYEDDDDDCVYYDTIYTNDTGKASTYDGSCGMYEWSAIYDDNQIDGGMYQIWAGCGNTGGGDEDYDEWFAEYGFEVDGYDINILYDPNTGCDCYVEVEIYVDIFKENEDPNDDGYVDSIHDVHMIYSEDEEWFVQNWSAIHYGEGRYNFHVYMYDQEYGHDEDEFWINDVDLGDAGHDLWFQAWWFHELLDDDDNHIWDEIYISFIPDTDFEEGDVDVLVEIMVFDEDENEVASPSESYTICANCSDEFGMFVSVDEPGYYYFEINLYDANHPDKSRDHFSGEFLMSDEWFDSTFQQDENTVYVNLDPKTNYEGEIETSYILKVYRFDDEAEYYQVDYTEEYSVIKGGTDNEDINFVWSADEDGHYFLRVEMMDYYWNLDHAVEYHFSIDSNQGPVIHEVKINGVLAENAILYEGLPLIFTVNASSEYNDELEYIWIMGDGSQEISTGDNSLEYHYLNNGLYMFEIVVSDGTNSAEAVFKLDVLNQAPTIDLAPYDSVINEGETIGLTAETHDTISDVVEVTWELQDGTKIGDTPHIEYKFSDDGDYTVTVRAKDEDGGESKETITITVNNVDPIFEEFILPTNAQEGQALDFVVYASDPGDDTITYTFDFGDGTAEILTKDGNVSHKFASGETFTIVICALDEDGGESCRTEELPVALLEQLEESGLPGFGLLGVITALGIIGILRRRTH